MCLALVFVKGKDSVVGMVVVALVFMTGEVERQEAGDAIAEIVCVLAMLGIGWQPLGEYEKRVVGNNVLRLRSNTSPYFASVRSGKDAWSLEVRGWLFRTLSYQKNCNLAGTS